MKFNCNCTIFLVNCANASNGEFGFCHCNTCSENEGDCDAHDECQDGLICGSKNCPASLGFDSDVDCCTKSKIRKLCQPLALGFLDRIFNFLFKYEMFMTSNLPKID